MRDCKLEKDDVMFKSIEYIILGLMFFAAMGAFGVKRVETVEMYCKVDMASEEPSVCKIMGYYSDPDNPGWKKAYNEVFVLQTTEKNALKIINRRIIQKKKSDEGIQ